MSLVPTSQALDYSGMTHSLRNLPAYQSVAMQGIFLDAFNLII